MVFIIPHFNKKKLTEKKYSHLQCPNCEEGDGIKITSYFHYLTLFWIPFFAFRKSAEVLCYRCKTEIRKKEQTRAIKLEIANLKSRKPIPFWTFIGGVLVLTSIIIQGVAQNIKESDDLAFLNQPKEGDVYGFYVKEEKLSTYRVIEVFPDSLYVSPNEFQTADMDEMKTMDRDELYADYFFPITRIEILRMYEDKTIIWVKRK